MTDNRKLHNLIENICKKDSFDSNNFRRIITNNLVKERYFNVWATLLLVSYICVNDKPLHILRNKKSYNSFESLCSSLELQIAKKHIYDYSEENPFVRAGDIESKGRLNNITRIEKAIYLINKSLLLNIFSSDPEDRKRENVITMLKHAMTEIRKTAAMFNISISDKEQDNLINSIMKDYLDSILFMQYCDGMASNENSVIIDNNDPKHVALEEEFTALNTDQVVEAAVHLRNDQPYQKQNTLLSSEKDCYTEKYFINENIMNGYHKIVYTFLIGICCCKLNGTVLKHILEEYFSLITENISSEKKELVLYFFTPVTVTVWSVKNNGKSILCELSPYINPIEIIKVSMKDRQTVELTFKGNSFSKIIVFSSGTYYLDFSSMLSEDEIKRCFDRQLALSYLNSKSSSGLAIRLSLMQLSCYGTKEDLKLLIELIKDYFNRNTYDIGPALKSLISLSIKTDDVSYSGFISKSYSRISNNYAYYPALKEAYENYLEFLRINHELIKYHLTVVSPVNVDVYLNSNQNCILSINKNDHNPVNNCTFEISRKVQENILYFYSRGIQRSYKLSEYDSDNNIFIDLNNYLSSKEIIDTYSIEDVKAHINNPTFYSIQQLKYIGSKEDISIVLSMIEKLPSKRINGLFPKLVECLCSLIIKHDAVEYIDSVKTIKKDCLDWPNPIIYEAFNSLINEYKIDL